MWARMGAAWRQDPCNLPEMQIPVLEQGEATEKVICVCKVCGKSFNIKPSEAEKRSYCSIRCRNSCPEYLQKQRGAHVGIPHPHKGFVHSEGARKKQGETMRKNWEDPTYRQRNKGGVVRSRSDPEVIAKISEKTREAMRRPEVRIKLNGPNHPNWQGGISFEPYCSKFNKEFKERVRAFFGYHCVECGTPQNGSKLHVHHVNFQKDSCCNDGVTPLFVSLCDSCHGKTGRNRDYWQQHFTEIINRDYGGKCYLPKPVIGNMATVNNGNGMHPKERVR